MNEINVKLVGLKDIEGKIEAMGKWADSLGMKRSGCLRWLVDKDLAEAHVAQLAGGRIWNQKSDLLDSRRCSQE